jgi:hypothetical protein
MLRSLSDSFRARLEHLAVLVVYTLLAALTSFPLVTQFGSHIAGVEGDVWSYLWAMGWARVSVLNLGANPFHTDYVFYPLGGATQLLWGTALPSFASIPLQLAFGLVPAFNLVYLASSVLTAYGTFLLGTEVFRSFGTTNARARSRAAFVSGLAFAFGALRLGYGLAFTNLFHTEFIPFYVLYLLKTTRVRGWKNVAWAGLFFGLNAYVDFQIAAFLALLTALWFLFVLARAIHAPKGFLRERSSRRVLDTDLSRLGARWLTMLGVTGLVVLPMLGAVLNDFAIEGGNYIRVFPLRYSADRSYDALAYFLPNARSTLYQNLPIPRVNNVNASLNTPDESELSPDRQSFLGVTLFLLALLGALGFGRKMLFWMGVTILFALLSLGPVLHIAGTATTIPLPFVLVNNIPILNNIRIPMRYGLLVFFGASLLAGAGALVVLRSRQWLIAPIVALLLVESVVFPYPTLAFNVPRIYEQIGQTPDDATVLEIPSFNWRYASKNEAYQVVHQKRILRAYTNRIAPDIADYFNLRQTPLVVRSLRILEGAEKGVLTPEELDEDRRMVQDTLAFFQLRYAILHRDQLPAERAAQIYAYLQDVMHARVLDDDGTVVAFEFPQAAFDAQARRLDLASNATLMYLGRGWQMEPLADVDGAQGRFVKSNTGQVYLPPSSRTQLQLDLYSAQDNVSLQAQVNDANADTLPLQQGWHTYALGISLPNRLNLLQLFFNANANHRFALGTLEQK